MSAAYVRIEADGAVFQAHADSQTGDVTLLVVDGHGEDAPTVEVHMSRNTAQMLALAFAGLAEEDDGK